MGLLVSSVSYRTGKSYVCAVCLLHTDLGQKDLLVATSRCVHVLHGIRHAQFPSIGLEFGLQNLMALFRYSLNLASSIKALLVWTAYSTALFGFLRMSNFHFPTVRLRLSRASLTATLFVCHPALPQDLRNRNFPRADHLLYPASSLSHVYVRPLKLLLARQLRSYSRRHSHVVVSFRLVLQSFTVYLRVG